MERPVRQVFGFFEAGKQFAENDRYSKALKDYEQWIVIDRERQKLENETLKLQNEEKRALVEALRKQQNISGSEYIYDRVKPLPLPEKPQSFFDKLKILFDF